MMRKKISNIGIQKERLLSGGSGNDSFMVGVGFQLSSEGQGGLTYMERGGKGLLR